LNHHQQQYLLAVISSTGGDDEEDERKPKTTSRYGPSSAPAFVRATTITDYNPNLCKDYNQTGYCGYGDSCIYIHDRTTYVSGNVLDQRWDAMISSKKKTKVPKQQEEEAAITTCCLVCKTVSNLLVKTRCNHIFCETCAYARFNKGITSCEECGAQTLGIFNVVIKRL